MEFLTAKDVATQLACNTSLVYQLIRSGEIEAIRIGNTNRGGYRITQQALDEFLASRKVEPVEPMEQSRRPPKPQLKKPKHLRVS